MHDSKIKARYEEVMPAVRANPESRRKLSEGMKKSWTVARKKQHIKRMRKGGTLQQLMQATGNVTRVGLPNVGARKFWKNISENDKVALVARRTEKLIQTIRKEGAGWHNRGYVKGKQGWLVTRFGKMRYDSGWEKALLSYLETVADVLSVSRDFDIPYYRDGRKHIFLVDFRVELKTRKPLLI